MFFFVFFGILCGLVALANRRRMDTDEGGARKRASSRGINLNDGKLPSLESGAVPDLGAV
jgi:hypothetical protein